MRDLARVIQRANVRENEREQFLDEKRARNADRGPHSLSKLSSEFSRPEFSRRQLAHRDLHSLERTKRALLSGTQTIAHVRARRHPRARASVVQNNGGAVDL